MSKILSYLRKRDETIASVGPNKLKKNTLNIVVVFYFRIFFLDFSSSPKIYHKIYISTPTSS